MHCVNPLDARALRPHLPALRRTYGPSSLPRRGCRWGVRPLDLRSSRTLQPTERPAALLASSCLGAPAGLLAFGLRRPLYFSLPQANASNRARRVPRYLLAAAGGREQEDYKRMNLVALISGSMIRFLFSFGVVEKRPSTGHGLGSGGIPCLRASHAYGYSETSAARHLFWVQQWWLSVDHRQPSF